MKLHYDRAADVFYVRLSERKIAKTDTVADGVNLDYDTEGELVGIEVLFVSQRVNSEAPESVALELLLGEPR